MKYYNLFPRHKYPWLATLYAIVLTAKPKTIIEYGTENGGTAIVMALALKELYESEGHVGKVFTYDTYEMQSKGEIGSNPNYAVTLNNIKQWQLQDFIVAEYGDFFEFCSLKNKQFDMLYFDIDNDGDKLLEMYDGCKSNIESGSIVMFEGGSKTRDNVPWMIEKNKTKMTDVNVPYKLLTPDQKYSCSILYNENIYDLTL
jgi:predicted O-methyltransferase YrrM